MAREKRPAVHSTNANAPIIGGPRRRNSNIHHSYRSSTQPKRGTVVLRLPGAARGQPFKLHPPTLQEIARIEASRKGFSVEAKAVEAAREGAEQVLWDMLDEAYRLAKLLGKKEPGCREVGAVIRMWQSMRPPPVPSEGRVFDVAVGGDCVVGRG